MMAAPFGDKTRTARSLWYADKGVVELRETPLPTLGPGEARVRTLYSGISRGTERLVFDGAIGRSEWERMRCPMQEGAFPFPVKYGYCAAGVVEDGPPTSWAARCSACTRTRRSFMLPFDRWRRFHRTCPCAAPHSRPTWRPLSTPCGTAGLDRAIASWWSAAAVVGLLVASLAARLPGADVTAIDVDESRQPLVEALGAAFARPGLAPGEADVVFHASASAAGLEPQSTVPASRPPSSS